MNVYKVGFSSGDVFFHIMKREGTALTKKKNEKKRGLETIIWEQRKRHG